MSLALRPLLHHYRLVRRKVSFYAAVLPQASEPFSTQVMPQGDGAEFSPMYWVLGEWEKEGRGKGGKGA